MLVQLGIRVGMMGQEREGGRGGVAKEAIHPLGRV